MKKITLLAFCLILFAACSKEQDFEDLTDHQSLDTISTVANAKTAFRNNKSFFLRGEPIYAGTGYNPNTDNLSKPAFVREDINYEIDNGRETQFLSEIQIIKNHREFEAVVKDYTIKNDSPKKLFVGISPTVVDQRIKLTETTASVYAKISFKTKGYQSSRIPRFTEEAISILVDGDTDKFLDTYGPMYIDKQDLGGDLYFFYTYRVANYNSNSETALETKVRNDLLRFINNPNSESRLSPEDQEVIKANLINRSFYTNLKGYNPLNNNITNVDDFEAEKQAVLRFIRQRQSRAATIGLNLKSYDKVLKPAYDERLRSVSTNVKTTLRNEFNKELGCYENLGKWKAVKASLFYIRKNTTDNVLRNDANTVIARCNGQIGYATNCHQNSVPPSSNEGQSILDRYQDELNRRD
ncbi:hypothetical protein [Maribacter sp. 2-571]|uniref:hypothetical protein n=1 Tax=Maribacter sp. 2-571 TaxID=3417569 RepID=UPI003D33575D